MQMQVSHQSTPEDIKRYLTHLEEGGRSIPPQPVCCPCLELLAEHACGSEQRTAGWAAQPNVTSAPEGAYESTLGGKKNMRKRILASLMALILALSLLPTAAFAVGEGTPGDSAGTEQGDSPVITLSNEIMAETTELTSGTYTLSGNVALNSALTVPANAVVTIDLGEYELSRAGDSVIVNHGTLTVRNGTVRMTGSGSYVNKGTVENYGTMELESGLKIVSDTGNAVTNFSGKLTTAADMEAVFNGGPTSRGSGIFVQGGDVEITGGTITAMMYALTSNGSTTAKDATATVSSGASLKAYRTAIYWPAGTLTLGSQGSAGSPVVEILTDATKNSTSLGTPLEVSGGTVNIYSGTYVGKFAETADDQTWMTNSGANNLGDAITIYTRRSPSYGSLEMNIYGGTFTSRNNYAIRCLDLAKIEQDVSVNIYGGTFTSAETKEIIHIAKDSSGTLTTAIASPVIFGGTFDEDVSAYVAPNYECVPDPSSTATQYIVQKMKDKLVVTPETDPDTDSTSATLEGSFTPGTTTEVGDANEGDAGTQDKPTGEVTGNAITINLTPSNDSVTSATLNVMESTAQSLGQGANSLEVTSTVGTVTLTGTAMEQLRHVEGDVAIKVASVQDKTDTWEVTVLADQSNIYQQGTLSHEDITIRVPYTLKAGETADNIKVFCLETGEDMGAAYVTYSDGNFLTWKTSHLSTFAKTVEKPDAETYYTTASNGVQYGTLADAIANVNEGGTITLQNNVTIKVLPENNAYEFYSLPGGVTINGGNHSITVAVQNVTGHNNLYHVFGVNGEKTVTIRDLEIIGDYTGNEDYCTRAGIHAYDGATVNLENVNIYRCGTVGIQVNGGTVNVTGGHISDNNWGGINVDSQVEKGSSLTVNGTDIDDAASIYVEHSDKADGYNMEVTVESGSYESISVKESGKSGDSITIESGTIGSVTNAGAGDVDITGGTITGNVTNSGTGRTEVTGGTVNGEVDLGNTTESYKLIYKVDGKTVYARALSGSDNSVDMGYTDTPFKSGYTFTGWSCDKSGVTLVTTIDGAKEWTGVRPGNTYTFTAQFSPIVTPVVPDDNTPSYSGGSSSSETSYSNTIDASDGGSVKVSPRTPSRGETVTITPTPDTGYEVDEVIVTDRNGDEVEVTANRNGTYTFEQPRGRVTIEVTFVRTGSAVGTAPFLDVAEDAWYAEAVAYVYDNGLMSGTSTTLFSPNATTTRGMIVTMLYRLEGEPRVNSGSTFDDVDAGMYYADAVAWASQNDIVTGYDETTFGPNNAITREQMAAILYRYAQYKGYRTTAGADLSGYVDADSVSSYALASLQWANAAGLVTGTSSNTLTPDGSATRAQVATIFMRFMEDVAE